MPAPRRSHAQDARETLPPVRRTRGDLRAVDAHVVPLGHGARVTVEEPVFDGVWLVQIAGTTADPTVFPPDRTLPQVNFDFRDLAVPDGSEPDDAFARFRELVADGLVATLGPRCDAARNVPRHLVFVGHSFGGMVAANFLLSTDLAGIQALVPSVERVTLVMVASAHVSPVPSYRIRSDAPVVGPLATWLSHHVMKLGTASKERLGAVMDLLPKEPPRAIWRDAWGQKDELRAVLGLPRASSLDHFWSVVRCAQQYDLERLLAERGGSLWVDLLVLSGARDTQWPEHLFDAFWDFVSSTPCPRARWCHFPGDDHLAVVRQPVKYYKEIKDFLLETRAVRLRTPEGAP